ncbi:MAG: hypothetical protein MRZ79_20630 [Bacteroidia bacterium]|nr:hypothetical protein [Bacteroidia bacterium]
MAQIIPPNSKPESSQKDTPKDGRPPESRPLPDFSTLEDTSKIVPPDTSKKSTGNPQEQAIIDSLKANSDLSAPVNYEAVDSIVYDVKSGVLFMYSQGSIKYDDLELKAERINIEIEKQNLHAEGVKNEEGELSGIPEFTQDGETYRANGLDYNFKSQKGLIYGGKIAQEEAFILAEKAKYQDDGSFHGTNGKYTACDLDHPHYYIRSKKIKLLDNDQIISGPLNIVVGDLPLPVVVPFAFLPNVGKGQKNGLIMPQYGNAGDRGYFLRNLGYYLGLNDYLSLTFDGDIYTRGGWRLGTTLDYKVRYKYSGNFNLELGLLRYNEPTDSDFRRSFSWRVRWTHNQPIDPTASLNASVNISSSSTFQREISFNTNDLFTNDLKSSVSFRKNFNNLPINFTFAADHSQDLNEGTMTINLPTFSLNLSRQMPFKNLDAPIFSPLKQFYFTYRMNGRNSIQNVPDSLVLDVLLQQVDTLTYFENEEDTALTVSPITDFISNGIQHNIAGGTNFKLFDLINIPLTFSYDERWYTETIRRDFDAEQNRVIETTVPGLARAYSYQAGLQASATFYGIYTPLWVNKRRGLKFRQQFNTSVGYTYRPDFASERFGFYDEVQTDSTRTKFQTYSRFANGIYGTPGQGESQSISFSLSSILAMKYKRLKQKKESEEDKENKGEDDNVVRTDLLKNISLSSAYNLAADSFQLSTFRLSARTSFLKNKINLTSNFTFDPYVFGSEAVEFPLDAGNARRLNKFLILEEGKLARLTNAGFSLNTTLRSKQKNARGKKSSAFDEEEYSQVLANYNQYYDFDIPWNIRLGYNFNYSKTSLAPANITSTVRISGDLNFTENWKVAVTTGLDLVDMEATTTSITITRPLHCWQFSFNWVPFGSRRSYSVVISARSSTLSALRLTKNEFWQDRFQTL